MVQHRLCLCARFLVFHLDLLFLTSREAFKEIPEVLLMSNWVETMVRDVDVV